MRSVKIFFYKYRLLNDISRLSSVNSMFSNNIFFLNLKIDI